jgi:hypothetical protein
MAVDIDEYLSQTEVGFTQESLNDMSDYGRNGFGGYGFGSYDSYNNNASMDPFSNIDPFSNDATGGQGGLSFSGINDQQDFVAPAGLEDHSSRDSESVYGHQASAPPGLDGHSSRDVEQSHDPSAMLIDGEFEDVPDSVEQGQNSREEELEEDEIPLKNEEHDSDGEFKEEDAEDEAVEEDQDDEEEDEGSKKKKKKEKRKPYKHSRILTRWDSKSA